MLKEKILYYSNMDCKFNNSPRVTKEMLKTVNNFVAKCFRKLDCETFDYYVFKKERFRINLDDVSCTCHEFLHRSACSHLIYISHSMEFNFGYYNPTTKFVFLKKRGRPKNAYEALVKD
ncbi:unnamed protein product [Brachionus calyciflorus]|uniref:SWIM-type domain-containing protein n=1 Tax=Brachionus calyciflorus TaxID=104777 RepID=A0A813NYS6_9BILA|nr:unnamed protein product [Brachionus calyciflorus]